MAARGVWIRPWVLLWLLCAGAAAEDLPQGLQPVVGRAQAIDGATLSLTPGRPPAVEVRIADLEAPFLFETCGHAAWPCGLASWARLQILVGGRRVLCVPQRRQDHVLLARCLAGGLDLGREMLVVGLARATAKAPLAYREAEAEARAARRGLWRGAG